MNTTNAASETGQHTPGPFEQRRNRIYTKGGLLVAECPTHGAGFVLAGDTAPWHNAENNARLLASAPELLEALIELRAQCIRNGFESELANQAIAKATGI